jgi:hypothetical protein
VAIPHRNPEDRSLSARETAVVVWLLEHGDARAAAVLPQVESARVIARCGCGCASVDFSVDGVTPLARSKLEVVSDYCWYTERGNLCGASVFLRAGRRESMSGRLTAEKRRMNCLILSSSGRT